ncbi:ParA family protein [Streptomyces pacificus]|uniref:ParA family protein n=2 Tax=Streptomyces pacificus TaxID=2705029 RepID=A0A6A0AXV6_9ACTN|nr:ParA family protein [Streptomyces pacificus]
MRPLGVQVPTMPGRAPSSGPEAVGSAAVRTFATHQRMTTTVHTMKMTDGQHVNATAGNGGGRESTHFADYDEVPEGHFYDPDAEYEPDPEYAATLAPDAARQRRERIGPTGRPLPYFPIPGPLTDHGPAKIIAMCNQKGGVGKTTSTINLGAALAEYGRRVLLVDFDPQGALSVGLGVNPMELDLTVYNLLMERGMSADEVLLKTAVPNMDLLPSNIDLSAAEVQLVSEVARESTLQRALKPLLQDYDYIVIDCQPSLGLLTVNALTAAHKVIVPLECEFFALRGVALLTETIEKVQERLNPELELDGILATMYDSRTVHSREVLARVVEAFDDHVYHTVIGRTVRFPETTVAGEPITTYASNSVGAAAYRQLAREVLARCHAE